MTTLRSLIAAVSFSAFGGLSAAEPATVLLITSSELKPAWEPFSQWKSASGLNTKIITIDEISKNSAKGDIQEKIRLTVREHIDKHGTKFVILGGDSLPGGGGHVPDRDTVHQTMWGKNNDIPTDIYYISPTNWDADGDGIYGEWKDDKAAITYPDGSVGLGRIPMRTKEDVINYTKKVVAYESKYPTKGDFATKLGYLCAVPQAQPKLKTSWEKHMAKTWKGGSSYRFYTNETPWDKDGAGSFALSPTNFTDLVNKGDTGKFHIHGHGLWDCWVFERHQKFTANHVSKLSNKGMYPMITTVSCFTGQYDSPKDPCISESMLRQPGAGAVLIVSPCREGKPHFVNPREGFRKMSQEGLMDGTTRTMTRFWETGLTKNLTAGVSLMNVKAEMVEKAKQSPNLHMCLCELNLLGDPTLSMRAVTPKTPVLTIPKTFPIKGGDLTVDSNSPGANVCIWKDGEVFHTTKLDKNGKAKFKIKPMSIGVLRVTITAPNLNTVSRGMELE